jgi:hypothetical protein
MSNPDLVSGKKMNFAQREKPQNKRSNGQGGMFSPRSEINNGNI